MKAGSVSSSNILTQGKRADALFHLSEGVSIRREISMSPYEIKVIGDVSERIFYGGRAKRAYVTMPDIGIPFLSSSDILQHDLSTVKLVSKKYTFSLNEMFLAEKMILISRSGTIGNTAFANKTHIGKLASEHVIRIIPNDEMKGGFVYAYLSSKYGHSLLTQGRFGGVIRHIEPEFVSSIPIPRFPETIQKTVDDLMSESASLREEYTALYNKAISVFKLKSKLGNISINEYNYYGPRSADRDITYFEKTNKLTDLKTSMHAFNHSSRNDALKKRIVSTIQCMPLISCLTDDGFFSTGSFPRIEVEEGKGVRLINQRDIFDFRIKGKAISARNIRLNNMVERDEVIIAGVGTLGENETFCRCVYANESLAGALVSGEFIRMKAQKVPSGYLYLWLSSEYGFRLIRSTQAGTKLCRPIHRLLAQIPVPILSDEDMSEINDLVISSQDKLALAIKKECEAIAIVEREIESWSSK